MIVDRETDKLKAEEQIKRSSFVKLSYGPNFYHIAKVKVWAEKWCVAGEISKEWKYYINIIFKYTGNKTSINRIYNRRVKYLLIPQSFYICCVKFATN